MLRSHDRICSKRSVQAHSEGWIIWEHFLWVSWSVISDFAEILWSFLCFHWRMRFDSDKIGCCLSICLSPRSSITSFDFKDKVHIPKHFDWICLENDGILWCRSWLLFRSFFRYPVKETFRRLLWSPSVGLINEDIFSSCWLIVNWFVCWKDFIIQSFVDVGFAMNSNRIL
jgi:hypothetical protein